MTDDVQPSKPRGRFSGGFLTGIGAILILASIWRDSIQDIDVLGAVGGLFILGLGRLLVATHVICEKIEAVRFMMAHDFHKRNNL